MLLLLRFFYVFSVFFQNPKVVTFHVLLPCFVRFLELWAQPVRCIVSLYVTPLMVESSRPMWLRGRRLRGRRPRPRPRPHAMASFSRRSSP